MPNFPDAPPPNAPAPVPVTDPASAPPTARTVISDPVQEVTVEREQNSPPVISLLTTSSLPSVVSVPKGQRYMLCSAGQTPSDDKPCELGAQALDMEDGDLTDMVLACAPETCAELGSCAGHRLKQKPDLTTACGIDTIDGNVGDVFPLTFTVVDSQLVTASVTRLIRVVDSCSGGKHLCDGVCSDLPCETSETLRSIIAPNTTDDNAPPQLLLNLPPSDLSTPGFMRSYVVPFGKAGLLQLAPCTRLGGTDFCAATAVDDEDGDLTDHITFEEVTSCAAGDCIPCFAASVLSGACLPGVHIFQYTVVDSKGRNNTALIRVQVEQQVSYEVKFVIDSLRTSKVEAERLAGELVADQSLATPLALNYLSQISNTFQASSLRNAALTRATALPSGVFVSVDGTSTVKWPLEIVLQVVIASLEFNGGGLTPDAEAVRLINAGLGRRKLHHAGSQDLLSKQLQSLSSPDPDAALLHASIRRATYLPHPADVQMQVASDNAEHVLQQMQQDAHLIVQHQSDLQAVVNSAASVLSRTGLQGRHLAQVFTGSQDNSCGVDLLGGLSKTWTTRTAAPAGNVTLKVNGKNVRMGSLLKVDTPERTRCLTPVPKPQDVVVSRIISGIGGLAKSVTNTSNHFLAMLLDARAVFAALNDKDGRIRDQYVDLVGASGAACVKLSTRLGLPTPSSPKLVLEQDNPANSTQVATPFERLVTSLQTADLQGQYISTATVLEAYGPLDQTMNVMGMTQYADCLYTRGFEPQYHFLVDTYSRGSQPETLPAPAAGWLNAVFSVDTLSQIRRRLTQTQPQAPSSGSLQGWGGYTTLSGSTITTDVTGYQSFKRQRAVGYGSGNAVLGGVLLHQTRARTTNKLQPEQCHSRFADLSQACWQVNSFYTDTGNSTDSMGAPLPGIGLDPIFNPYSKLFQPELSTSVGQYYNTSTAAGEMAPSGVPRAFFSEALEHGYPVGYPVFVSNELTSSRLSQVLAYLKDAPYLSPNETDSLSAEMLMYNSQYSVLTYLKLMFSWSAAGGINIMATFKGMPAAEYGGSMTGTNWRAFAPDLLILLIAVAYLVLTIVDHIAQYRASQRLSKAKAGLHRFSSVKHELKTMDKGLAKQQALVLKYSKDMLAHNKPIFWLVYETLSCIVLLCAIILYFYYVFYATPHIRLTSRFQVYDADAGSPARFFLTARDSSPDTTAAKQLQRFGYCLEPCIDVIGRALSEDLGQSLRAPNNSKCSNCLAANELQQNSTTPNPTLDALPIPGAPFRWALPAKQGQGLASAADMMHDARTMHDIFAAYSFLQSVLLLMLIGRLISHLMAQPHWSVIPKSFGELMPDFLHLMVIVTATVLMCAMAVVVVFGDQDAVFSDYNSCLNSVMTYLASQNGVRHLQMKLTSASMAISNPAARLFGWVMAVLVLGVFVFMLLTSFVSAMVLYVYKHVHAAAKQYPSTMDGLKDRAEWIMQVINKKAPGNVHLQRLLDKVLDDSDYEPSAGVQVMRNMALQPSAPLSVARMQRTPEIGALTMNQKPWDSDKDSISQPNKDFSKFVAGVPMGDGSFVPDDLLAKVLLKVSELAAGRPAASLDDRSYLDNYDDADDADDTPFTRTNSEHSQQPVDPGSLGCFQPMLHHYDMAGPYLSQLGPHMPPFPLLPHPAGARTDSEETLTASLDKPPGSSGSPDEAAQQRFMSFTMKPTTQLSFIQGLRMGRSASTGTLPMQQQDIQQLSEEELSMSLPTPHKAPMSQLQAVLLARELIARYGQWRDDLDELDLAYGSALGKEHDLDAHFPELAGLQPVVTVSADHILPGHIPITPPMMAPIRTVAAPSAGVTSNAAAHSQRRRRVARVTRPIRLQLHQGRQPYRCALDPSFGSRPTRQVQRGSMGKSRKGEPSMVPALVTVLSSSSDLASISSAGGYPRLPRSSSALQLTRTAARQQLLEKVLDRSRGSSPQSWTPASSQYSSPRLSRTPSGSAPWTQPDHPSELRSKSDPMVRPSRAALFRPLPNAGMMSDSSPVKSVKGSALMPSTPEAVQRTGGAAVSPSLDEEAGTSSPAVPAPALAPAPRTWSGWLQSWFTAAPAPVPADSPLSSPSASFTRQDRTAASFTEGQGHPPGWPWMPAVQLSSSPDSQPPSQLISASEERPASWPWMAAAPPTGTLPESADSWSPMAHNPLRRGVLDDVLERSEEGSVVSGSARSLARDSLARSSYSQSPSDSQSANDSGSASVATPLSLPGADPGVGTDHSGGSRQAGWPWLSAVHPAVKDAGVGPDGTDDTTEAWSPAAAARQATTDDLFADSMSPFLAPVSSRPRASTQVASAHGSSTSSQSGTRQCCLQDNCRLCTARGVTAASTPRSSYQDGCCMNANCRLHRSARQSGSLTSVSMSSSASHSQTSSSPTSQQLTPNRSVQDVASNSSTTNRTESEIQPVEASDANRRELKALRLFSANAQQHTSLAAVSAAQSGATSPAQLRSHSFASGRHRLASTSVGPLLQPASPKQ